MKSQNSIWHDNFRSILLVPACTAPYSIHMSNANASPETVYIGYSAEELEIQRQAENEAMIALAILRETWKLRRAIDRRLAKAAADRAKLEQAVTQMASSLESKGPIAPGRELPFLLERRVAKPASAPATVKLQSGVRRKSNPLFMSQVAYCA